MRYLLDSNLIYKLIAVFVALILWFNAWEHYNPIEEEVFNVPLEIQDLPPTLVAVEVPGNIQIRVEGRSGVLEGLTSRDFQAFVELEGALPGYIESNVEVKLPGGVRLVSLTPSRAGIRVDEVDRMQLPVTVVVDGNPAPGYKDLDTIVEPNEVIIRGPKSLLNRVENAVVEVSINNYDEDYVRVLPVSIQGERLDERFHLNAIPSSVQVFVPIVREGESIEVPVQANLKGNPAEGYEVSNVRVTPRMVQIFGSEAVLETTDYLNTFPIDIEGKNRSFAENVMVHVPEGVDFAQIAGVSVYVEITRN